MVNFGEIESKMATAPAWALNLLEQNGIESSRIGLGMKALLSVTFLAFSIAGALGAPLSDAEIRREIIQESLAGYPGPCPCPYNLMRNGRACSGRSAYIRPGGYSPICYDRDISPEMVQSYRATHR